MIAEGPAYASLLAALHVAAFKPAERWDACAMAVLLDMPGCFACLLPAPDPQAAPIGMALLRVAADEAEILSIAVLPSWQRQGKGGALLREALAEARRRGASRVLLEVSVGNAGGRALYRACGFRQVGQRRAYYPDGSDALLLAREETIPCGSRPA